MDQLRFLTHVETAQPGFAQARRFCSVLAKRVSDRMTVVRSDGPPVCAPSHALEELFDSVGQPRRSELSKLGCAYRFERTLPLVIPSKEAWSMRDLSRRCASRTRRRNSPDESSR